jgi:hypothetical protein
MAKLKSTDPFGGIRLDGATGREERPVTEPAPWRAGDRWAGHGTPATAGRPH